jgi:thymidylate synthase ThyX
MEKKMDKDPESAESYIKKFVEHEDKKYIRKLSTEEAAVVTPKAWYLPHFAAIRTSQGSQDSYSMELLKFLDPH